MPGTFVVWGFCSMELLSFGAFVTVVFTAGVFVAGASVAAPTQPVAMRRVKFWIVWSFLLWDGEVLGNI